MTMEKEVIKGNWRNSKIHGYAERNFNNGECFKGNWVEGKLTGRGERISFNEHYVGHFVNNKEDGRGKLTAKAEIEYVYEGQFKSGLMHGFGK